MRMDMQWAPLLHTLCSPLTHTPSFSSADDAMTRCGALGLRGEMATSVGSGIHCQWYSMLCPFILNAATTAGPYIPHFQLLEDLKLVRYQENW
jgi:hypothetical protein